MNRRELIEGYETEIAYQKHMIENLGRWFSLFFTLASLGLVLLYFFRSNNIWLFSLGLILLILGVLAMLLFGYGIYRGRHNLQLVIDDFEAKLKAYH
ncbi:DUF202 domain-containing protein [Streptococcus oricebi]|uniref:PTS fructose transporter subunit IA n=1 Tax=Streptococcus oricebi TaxID=1547447 RepID=A0ABS5B426_9STRE|nr:DUF202 domain-containing protein [Streptococcus oricebi]MBP2623581.1 PTS fructose transporter subunit IA [Streptococcus oricebi]